MFKKIKNYVSLFLVILILLSLQISNVLAKADNTNSLFVIKQDNKYGYMDINGNVVINPIFMKANNFEDGLAAVKLQPGIWGIINTQRQLVSKWVNVDEIFEFSEGMAVIRQGAKYGYINKDKLVIPLKYDGAEAFSEGLAAVIIRKGSTVIEKLHNAKYGYINKNDEVIIDFKFKAAGKFKEGVAPVHSEKMGEGWGYIDKTGAYVIEAKYFTAREFSEGLAPVTITLGKSGYINHQGNFVIPPQYNWTYSFSDGLARVEVEENPQTSPFSAKNKGKYGFINKLGQMVIKPKFDYAENFNNGLVRIGDKSPGFDIDPFWDISLGYIDKNGSVKWPLTR